MCKRASFFLAYGLFASVAVFAATPPTLMNYQGVLRDPATNAPLTGSYDMVFHFFDAQMAGNEILFDQHLTANSQAVAVSGGLFSVQLGSGQVFDGAGSGTYTSLADVFRDYATAYFEIQIGSEHLSPRVRVVSAAYALNAAHLGGKTADSFLDTSANEQVKAGELIVGSTTGLLEDFGIQTYGLSAGAYCKDLNASGQAYLGYGDGGIQASGAIYGGFFYDADSSGYAYAGYGDFGISGYGNNAGGTFRDLDGSGQATVGYGDTGILAFGTLNGGSFHDADSSGYAYVGSGDRGIEGYGSNAGGYFKGLNNSGQAYVGYGDTGIQASGNLVGGLFSDSDNFSYAYAAHGDRGIEGYGNNAGGLFQDSDNSGYAFVGVGERGIEAYGNEMGGYFEDTDSSGYAYVGSGDYGVIGVGNDGGAFFEDRNNSGRAFVGIGERGIEAYGNGMGGFFKDFDNSGYAYVGVGDHGIEAYGNEMGGYFEDTDGSGLAYVGSGDYGVIGTGNNGGGFFKDRNNSGYAYVGLGDSGIEALGNEMGGFFKDFDNSGYAYVGLGDSGIQAFGDGFGGYFKDSNNSGTGTVGNGDTGITAYGNDEGGFFLDLNNSGYALVGYGDRGIWGKGLFAGGTFSHPDNVTFWADVGRPIYKIYGTGTVSFVQNHPYEKDKVVVYAAPEGDEVAVYTRGTARLVNGEALVKLGETFALVANPDVGLTAQVTPIGDPVPLSVVDKSTSELRVRGPAGSSAEFDYLVYGLRIGFERQAPVQVKEREAFLPEAAAFDQQVAGHAELGSLTALSRFSAERAGGGARVDLTRSRELAAAIDENKDTIIAAAREAAEAEKQAHVAERPLPGETSRVPPEPLRAAPELTRLAPAAGQAATAAAPSTSSQPATPGAGHAGPLQTAQVPSHATAAPRATYELLPASGRVEPGDVLVLDPLHDGVLTASAKPADPLVVGCAAVFDEGFSVPDGQAALAASRIVLCRADASFGAIAVGDWLATSPTPGHAMRAADVASGAILGKAAEPLEAGASLIRVVVTLR
jgi:hypothetical protein